MDRCSNVGANHTGVNADAGISLGGEVESAEGGPEEGARWDESADHVGARHLERIADEHGRPAAKSSTQEEVQADAVGGRDAGDAIAAGVHLAVVELPLEDDLPVAAGQLALGERLYGCGRALQRCEARWLAGGREGQQEQPAASGS